MEKIEELANEMARVALEQGMTVEVTVKPIVRNFSTVLSDVISQEGIGTAIGEFKS